jgi:hypothetical protein
MKRLLKIQGQLKAPKSLRNNFGKYNYRSAEGILEAVKPLLVEANLILVLTDEIIQVGDRIYIKAIAKIYEESGNLLASVEALAREAEFQKGMSESQITGSTSSYARKYALNGLFLLDDTKDDDYNNNSSSYTAPAKQRQQAKKSNGIVFREFATAKGVNPRSFLDFIKADYGVADKEALNKVVRENLLEQSLEQFNKYST